MPFGAMIFLGVFLVGSNILTVIYNFVRGEYMAQNPFIQLEVAAIIYFVTLMFYKRKHGG